MPPTREEQLQAVRSEWSQAVDGGTDIHEWMARAMPFIHSNTDRFRFTEAVREVAFRGRASPLHLERVALIRSVLALASVDQPEIRHAPVAVLPPSISIGTQVPAIRISESSSLLADQGILWFWHHCYYRVRWSLIAWSASAVVAILGAGFAAGRTNLFVRIFDAFQDTSATAPAIQPIQPPTEPTTNANKTDPAK
jgi:hypothetical protein